MIKKLLIALPLLTVFFSYGQHRDQSRSIDVSHYTFSLAVNDSNNVLDAKAVISCKVFKKSTAISLDLIGLKPSGIGMVVSSAVINGLSVSFMQKDDKLVLSLSSAADTGQFLEATVLYTGVPADGLIYSKNKYGHRTIFGDNWPNRARNWLVCIDDPADKAAVDFEITAPNHYQVVSNGIKTEETNLPGNLKYTRWTESVPLATEVMTVGIADFAVGYAGEAGCIPVYSWVFPEDREKGFLDYQEAKGILSYFIDQVGPYPYHKLANVQSKTIFGGMENASCIFYSEGSVSGKQQIGDLLAHEIAHQWFGNSVTETDFSNLWLSEGFATYMTNLYLEHKYGRDTLVKRLKVDRDSVISFCKRSERPIIDSSSNLMSLLNINSYQKGGWVLHMLREKLGTQVFWCCIRKYYALYQGKNASTGDLETVMEEESHVNLHGFFGQWLYRGGIPVLSAGWSYDEGKKEVIIKITQEQNLPFEFPLEIGVYSLQQSSRVDDFLIKEKSGTYVIKLPYKPDHLVLDPQMKLLFDGTARQIK